MKVLHFRIKYILKGKRKKKLGKIKYDKLNIKVVLEP